jgi:CHAT domain-containing protein/Tfp pilus assembly protein PilF
MRKLYWIIFYALLIFAIFLSPLSSFSQKTLSFEDLIQKSDIWKAEGKFEEALSILIDNFVDNNSRISSRGKRDLSLRIGFLKWNLGIPLEALESFQYAREYSPSLDDSNNLALIDHLIKIINLYSSAKNLRTAGAYSEAISAFEQAIELSRVIKHPEFESKCLRQMSMVFLEQNNLEEFKKLNELSLVLSQELKLSKDEGYCLNNIGLYYYKLDDYSKALSFYEDSLKIAHSSNNSRAKSECLTNIGIIYKSVGNFEKALSYFETSLTLDRKTPNIEFIIIDLNNIGTIYRNISLISNSQLDQDQSIKYLKECYALADSSNRGNLKVRIANNIGTIYSDLQEYSKALDFYNQGLILAEASHDKEGLCLIYNNIGIVYSQMGKYEESTGYYQKAIDIAVEAKAGQVLWEAFLEMANSFKKQNRFADALKSYQYSIDVIEKTRSTIETEEMKATYLGSDRRLEAYHNMVDLLYRMNKQNPAKSFIELAFHHLEKSKARGFLDSLEVARVSVVQKFDIQQANTEKEINNDLARIYKKLFSSTLSPEQRISAGKEIQSLEDSYATLKREIRARNPVYAGLRFPEILDLKTSQNELIPRKTIVFTYSLGKDESYGLAITKTEEKLFPLPSAKDLKDKIGRYLKSLSDPENSDFSLGKELYDTLLAPALDISYPHILIIPDGVLHYLPFEALRPSSEANWLISNSDVTYAPSLTSLREIIERSKSRSSKRKKELLAIGDPDYGNSSSLSVSFPGLSLSQLAYSGKEIDEIAKSFPASHTSILKGKAATEQAIKSLKPDDYRIIHFAAHGLIDDQFPARSSLVLSLDPNSSEDGLFQAREVFDLRLNTDLVVLSSCHSAGGRLIRGEGIEGLNRAFFFAGTSAVLMSLWPINDEATSQLMNRFYFHLKSGNSIARALQNAKIDMIATRAYSHPFFWAGFMVSGLASNTIYSNNLLTLYLIIVSIFILIFITLVSALRRG